MHQQIALFSILFNFFTMQPVRATEIRYFTGPSIIWASLPAHFDSMWHMWWPNDPFKVNWQ